VIPYFPEWRVNKMNGKVFTVSVLLKPMEYAVLQSDKVSRDHEAPVEVFADRTKRV